MNNKYTCAMCGEENTSDVACEDAYEGDNKEFGGTLPPIEDCAIVCDDCYQKIRPKNNPMIFEMYKVNNNI